MFLTIYSYKLDFKFETYWKNSCKSIKKPFLIFSAQGNPREKQEETI